MRFLVQLLLLFGVVVGLLTLLSGVSDHWTDWAVVVVLLSGVLGVGLAVFHPRYPPSTRIRGFRRESGER